MDHDSSFANVQVSFCSKTEDFSRRTMWIYDWDSGGAAIVVDFVELKSATNPEHMLNL